MIQFSHIQKYIRINKMKDPKFTNLHLRLTDKHFQMFYKINYLD